VLIYYRFCRRTDPGYFGSVVEPEGWKWEAKKK
jgi:hypothetical protein